MAIKFGKTVRIGYVYNLAILNVGEFCIALPRTRAYITCCETVGYYILLANLKFGNRLFNRQIAKLKPPPKFPVIRYVRFLFLHIQLMPLSLIVYVKKDVTNTWRMHRDSTHSTNTTMIFPYLHLV